MNAMKNVRPEQVKHLIVKSIEELRQGRVFR